MQVNQGNVHLPEENRLNFGNPTSPKTEQKKRKLEGGEILPQETLNKQMKLSLEESSTPIHDRKITVENDKNFIQEIQEIYKEYPKSLLIDLQWREEYYSVLLPIVFNEMEKLNEKIIEPSQFATNLEKAQLINEAHVVLNILDKVKNHFNQFEILWKSLEIGDRFLYSSSDKYVMIHSEHVDTHPEDVNRMVELRRDLVKAVIHNNINEIVKYDSETRVRHLMNLLSVNGLDNFVFAELLESLDIMSFHHEVLDAAELIREFNSEYEFSDYDMNMIVVALAATNDFQECDNVIHEMRSRDIPVSDYTLQQYSEFKRVFPQRLDQNL